MFALFQLSLRKQLPFSIILAVLLVVLSVLLNRLQVLERWDNLFYDLETSYIKRPVDDGIVIVAIDERSLDQLGRWPWSRALHALMLDQLTATGVAAIGMDVLFMEPDLKHPDEDRLLVDAIRRNGNVVLPVLTGGQHQSIVAIKPVAEIAAAAAQLAHVNMRFDAQGVARKFDLQISLADGQQLPSMSLALNRLLQRQASLGKQSGKSTVLLTFAGPPGYFHRVSFVDVLLDSTVRQNLNGKTVLIGMTAAGLGSRIATPVSKTDRLMSGIEFHANALAAIRSGLIIRPLSLTAYILASAALLAIPVLLYPHFKPRIAFLLTLIAVGVTFVVSFMLLRYLQLWFAPLSTLLCLLLGYPIWSWRRLEQLGYSLFREHEKAGATLKAIDDAVITLDDRGRVEFMNPAAEKMLACALEDVKQEPFSEICQIAEPNESGGLESYSLGEAPWEETKIIRNRLGKEYTVRFSSSPLYAENGFTAGVVYAFSDLTELIKINRKIAFIAAHDNLTGLPNRVLLQDRLERAIVSASRNGSNFALLFIDLDDFKKINDGMGHNCGDLLLQEVARRLRNWVRQSDTISRWGGDEFIVLLADLTFPKDAADVAVKILDGLADSFVLEGQEVFITPSIGISLFPQDGPKAEVLLAKADAAMYSVKKNGRNDFCFYSQDLESLAKERLIMEKELRHALQSDQFEMHYQPQIDLISNRLIGAEALVRWRHPDRGLIAPDQFIPLAEEIGLIVPLGEWIFKTVCKQIKLWEESGLPVIKIAINLSPRQFVQKDLVDIINREIREQGVSAEKIQVEITESMIIQDIERVIQILNNLKSSGISIAIDDFGTGFSSLEYLKRFPIDKLKIDKSFVASVLQNQDDASIVQAVIALGHNMNMQIIAEGVETEEQVRFLQDRSCDYGQGYFFSKPLDDQDMGRLIAAFNPDSSGDH